VALAIVVEMEVVEEEVVLYELLLLSVVVVVVVVSMCLVEGQARNDAIRHGERRLNISHGS
jgi:hypothetical protein